jgi:hypothetical protein
MMIGGFDLMTEREPRADGAKAAALVVRRPRRAAAEGRPQDRR